MKTQKTAWIGAAVAGILGAGTAVMTATASAAEKSPTGQCIGANSCKGKSACSVKGANGCAGQNSCKGKGFLEKTKADCEKLAKKNKAIHFEATKS